MADNEKTTGIPIEDEALDNVAGGVEITHELLNGLNKLNIPQNGTRQTYSFEELYKTVETTVNRQNDPNDYYSDPSDGQFKTMEDYMREGAKNYYENQK